MIERSLTQVLLNRVAHYPVLTLTGPRQSGKTTLCRALFPEKTYFNLEALDTREFALNDPRGFLAQARHGAILDEIQRAPDLLSYLQEEVDRDAAPGRFVLTGSENLSVSAAVSQSLAGRTGVLHLLPCTWEEVAGFPGHPGHLWEAIWQGGFPRVFDRSIPPPVWYEDYLSTYVERDVRGLLKVGDLRAFTLFMRLAAGRTGQELNLSSLASDVGVAVGTVKAWISVLEASFLVALVPAWHTNVRKRAIKAPKLHFLDSGLACHLLGIRAPEQLALHPLRGAVFESWVAAEVIKNRLNRGFRPDCHHYRTSVGGEIDLLVRGESGWHLLEAKSAQTVDTSFVQHLVSLAGDFQGDGVASLKLVYGGDRRQRRSEVDIMPWREIQQAGWN